MPKLQYYTIICITFLAFLPLMYQLMYPCLTAEELFSKNFIAQKFLVRNENYRSSSSSDNLLQDTQKKELYYKAATAYSKKEYTTTTLLFERYLQQSSKDRKHVSLYLGIAYLKTNQLEAAKKEFQFLTQNGANNKKQDAEWYLVLTLLKQKEIELVKNGLTKILNAPITHTHKKKAQTLLKEIQYNYRP